MVHYLQEVQGPKYVVGRDIASIAATPEARRLFLSTAKYLLLQVRTPVPARTVRIDFNDWAGFITNLALSGDLHKGQ